MKLKEHLRGLDRSELLRLLELRPDVLVEPAPRDWEGLAKSLSTHSALQRTLEHLDRDALHVTQALQVLGPDATPESVAVLLDSPPPLVESALDRLRARALVWQTPDGRLACPPRLAGWWAVPLGLGAPAAELLAGYALPALRELAAAHGLPDSTRGSLTDALAARLGTAVAGLPDEELAVLRTLAEGAPRRELTEPARAGLAPLLDRGLLLHRGKTGVELPREVGLALEPRRGRHRLTGPPPLPVAEASARLTVDESSIAAAEAVRQATTLLEAAEASPVPALLTGGVGTRERRRLARVLRCPLPATALWLDLAHSAGLLGQHTVGRGPGKAYAPTSAYDTWRARPPAARWVTLARAWLRLEEAPTHRVRADGKPVPPPLPNPGPAARQRAALLRLYAELPEDRGVADPAVLDRLAWQLPLLAAATAHLRAVAEAVLAEARLLGLVAGDQLSPAGRALLDADDPETPIDPGSFDAGDGLLAAAATLLPGTTDRVLLQSDLTAVAAGDPGQHLVRLLDTAADVESSGAARIWRFSAATVRRALDTGKSADQLIDALHAVAPDGLPQPLEYLIRDVARQHGSVRVLDAGCLVLAQDGIQALEIMNSPAADWLGLRQVADAVLLSPRPRPDTLGRLRRAGFLPVGQDSQGTDQPEDPVPTRGLVSTKTRYRPRTADPDELLAALAASPDEDPYDPEVHLRTAAPELPLDDRLRLAEAVRRGLGVEITYPMPDGTGTARPVSDLALERGTLLAWCHRHHTEALFDLARITRVGVPGAVRLMAESGPNRYP